MQADRQQKASGCDSKKQGTYMKAAIASLLLASGLTLATQTAASATTLVDYGINDRYAGTSAISNPNGYQAIGFNLTSASTLTGLSIYLDGLKPRPFLPTSGSQLTWKLYKPTGNTGVPGNVVYNGLSDELSGSLITSTSTSAGPYDRMLFNFALPSLALDAGFYYLGLHIDGAGAVGMVGSSRPDLGAPAGYYTLNGGRTWRTDYAQALTINGAVPEPATWAMMIVGFGLAGGTLRRRRSAITTPLTC